MISAPTMLLVKPLYERS